MKHILLIFLVAMVLPACATITTGTDHSLSVVTDPPGAACELRRGGDVVGIVNPTPGTVRIDKSYRDISVECARPGNSRGTSTVSAGFQPMFLGNILIGGVIGMGVDLISAAGATYPNTVYIALRPTERVPNQDTASLPAQALTARDAAVAAVAANAPAQVSLEQYVTAARAECQRQRRRNCDAAAEQAARDFEDARQARLSPRAQGT